MRGSLRPGFFRLLWRISRQVFHETMGALFFFFALFGGLAAWKQWRGGTAPWLAGLAAGFTLMMFSFGIISFRLSRRVR